MELLKNYEEKLPIPEKYEKRAYWRFYYLRDGKPVEEIKKVANTNFIKFKRPHPLPTGAVIEFQSTPNTVKSTFSAWAVTPLLQNLKRTYLLSFDLPPSEVETAVPLDTLTSSPLCDEWKFMTKLGEGSFGVVYKARNIISGEEVAIKLENIKAKHTQLAYEAMVYKSLAGGVGIPFVRLYGTKRGWNYLVVELLGPSLEDVLEYCGGRLSVKTVALLGLQLVSDGTMKLPHINGEIVTSLSPKIDTVKHIHTCSLIHRDLKPENLCMGLGEKGHMVNIIDFSLAKKYRDPKTHVHIPYKENKNLTGTARYASINTHLGIESSRRDDLQCIAYTMIYLLRGRLPWQGFRVDRREHKQRVLELKQSIAVTDLCQDLPEEFVFFLTYITNLKFESEPDYEHLKNILQNLIARSGYENVIYDWMAIDSAQGDKTDVKARVDEWKKSVRAVKDVSPDYQSSAMEGGSSGKVKRKNREETPEAEHTTSKTKKNSVESVDGEKTKGEKQENGIGAKKKRLKKEEAPAPVSLKIKLKIGGKFVL
ncbi:serine/threonine protein kinase [Rhizophlyctis rosea]|uniref:non-specific serine/threonine protein kinase n=1 Tax=Rhizophlyctis rosea TaxID=64517 RepID=A0AAD5SGN2_9FUNG|nr:serine/threonine protein kinase [Rhizophlyctis rosea]